MASKFWGGSDSSSADESSENVSDDYTSTTSSSDDSSDDSDRGPSKYLQDESSDSSEDERRVIRSSKQKHFEMLKQSSRELQRVAAGRDWTSVIGSLESFHKHFLKSTQASIRAESSSKIFVRTLVSLSEVLDACSHEVDFKKQMSTTQAKAFNSLSQRVKKHMRALSPADIEAASRSRKIDIESESESADSTDTIDGTRDNPTAESDKLMQDIMNMPKEDVTFDMIDSKLKEIATSRGKKGVDRMRSVEQLRYVSSLSKCAAQEVEILLHIISAQFDLNGSMSTYMATPVWRNCVNDVLCVLQTLETNDNILLVDGSELEPRPSNDEIMAGAIIQLRGSLCAFAERIDDEYTKSLQCLDAHTKEYINRLQDEGALLLLLHQVSNFYESRNSHNAVSLSLRVLERIHCKRTASYNALKKYTDSRIQSSASVSGGHICDNGEMVEKTDLFVTNFRFPSCELHARIESLSAYIFNYGEERAKARALLCQIFNEALCGHLRSAKELLLMSHLQESIQLMDISTQILFNRAVAQLGVCAFELGEFDEAFVFLCDLFTSGRTKELLAQGMTQPRFNERSAEQDKLERRRQLPKHQHINLDFLESIFLVCAMLLEVSGLLNVKKTRVYPRYFSRIMDQYNRQPFTGPPDNTRDTVMAATKMLLVGDYKGASGLLLNLPAWNSLSPSALHVLTILDERLKIETIRVYLQQFADQYASASVHILAQMVSLTNESVCSIISSMIADADIPAVFDSVTQSLQLSRVHHNQLQSAASAFTEKVLILLDANERAFDRHIGTENISYYDEDESRTRRQAKSAPEPEEYQTRRLRSENARGRFITVDLHDGIVKAKQRDSYGHFSRKQIHCDS